MIINKELFFDDLDCFWLYAMQDSKARQKSSRITSWRNNWAGCSTWEEACVMARSGWYDGMLEIEKYRAQIQPFITSKVLRPQQIYAVAGYCVDIGSFMANQPEYFLAREYKENNSPGHIYRIVCSIFFSAAITPKTIIQRGAMICALVDAMEYAGHRVEVICNDAMSAYSSPECRQGQYKEKGWMETSVIVKKASTPVDLSDLAFCLAHPAMLRRIMFSVCELNGWSDFSHCYGYPAEATDKGDLYVREIFSDTVPDQQAIEWVLAELKKIGVDIETN